LTRKKLPVLENCAAKKYVYIEPEPRCSNANRKVVIALNDWVFCGQLRSFIFDAKLISWSVIA
jgi:hypothetical protein